MESSVESMEQVKRRRGQGPRFDGDMMSILEVSRDLMCICRTGIVVAINTAGARMLAAESAEQLIGRRLTDFVIPDYRPVVEMLLLGDASEEHPVPTRLLAGERRPRDVELQVFRAREIAHDAVVVVCRDTSREGQLANLAQEQDARIHLMVDNAMNLVAHIRDGAVHYVNGAGIAMLGAPGADALVGLPLANLFHEDYGELLEGETLEAVMADRAPTPMRLKRLDGGILDATVMIARLPSHRGGELMIEARDITAHNRAVVALRTTNETLERRVAERTAELEKANRSINDGIRYASRIQTAMLPDREALAGLVDEMAVGWHPLDIVSGDYYWAGTVGGKGVVAVMDCTGHGVPGAFMTAVVAASFSRILHHHTGDDPAEMLAELNRLVKSALRQDRDVAYSNDGLDAAVCVIDPAAACVTFAGAKLALLVGRGNGFEMIKPDRMSLGYLDSPANYRFTAQRIPYRPGDTFYLFTDGVSDQVGGPRRQLFGRTRLCDALAQVTAYPLEQQMDFLFHQIALWRGDEPPRDDQTFLAFRPAGGEPAERP
ncbi:MAG: SpoIIE family protein phosphatase [Magnetospirillum sp.]|nr:SpoIIE family protein phosphatase [Magnetospirillum sp.]